MKCPECKWDYPSRLLSPIITNRGSSPPVCGICALEFTNSIHGVKRTSFTGKMAESMRLDAIEHRQIYPTMGPK